jgi:transposase
MEIHNTYHVQLRHVCIGDHVTFVLLDKHQFICPKCRQTEMQQIPFQAAHHRITVELLAYTENLLSLGYTNKEVSGLTGLHQGVEKNIDKARLQRLYTEDGKSFKRPTQQSTHLAIDEFKLHDGYKFATHIIDLDTGHVLWIQEGKKKQVVYDFIDFVGEEWMAGVEAVACDMNSDFQEAFEERCPDILQTVDDYRRCRRWTLWRKSWKADRMMKVFLRELWYYIIRQTIDNQKTGSTGMRPIPTGMRRKETP